MLKKRISDQIPDDFSTDWVVRLWQRLVPEVQLDRASTECKGLYFKQQNLSLSSAIKSLSIVMSVVWATTYFTDNKAGILSRTIFFRAYYQIYLLILIFVSSRGFFLRTSNRINRAVLLFSFLQVCIFQGLITQYANQSTVLFVLIVNVIAASLSQPNFFQLLLYILASNASYFYISGDFPSSTSGAAASFITSVILFQCTILLIPCTFIYQQVKVFIDVYNKDVALKKALELTLKINEAISTFLSQNHKDRISYATSMLQLSYPDAFFLVTNIRRHEEVVILYQDIRAFTSTMRISANVEDTITKMMSQSSEVIDNSWGNASDKGDLLLAYFDDSKLDTKITLSLHSAFMLNKITQEMNKASTIKIRRYPILTLSSCSTGNVASTSKRLIDAKGNAANLAARIDEITKFKELKAMIESQDIVLDSNYYNKMISLYPELQVLEINLEALGIKIRDFEEKTQIYILKHSASNQKHLETSLKIKVHRILNKKQAHLEHYFNYILEDQQANEQTG